MLRGILTPALSPKERGKRFQRPGKIRRPAVQGFNVRIILGILSLYALAARAALPQPDLIAQIHFAGAQKISASPHPTAFTNEFCSAEALALRAQTAAKLAGWLAGWLQTNLNTSVPEGAAKLRPLLEDLQKSEFFLEARAAANGKPEVAVAIKLDPSRAQLWQANLKPFFATATFKSAGGWLIFDSNPALLGLGDKLAQRVSTPPTDWFDLDVNWPRLAQWQPALKELGLPETQFTVTAPDNNFRVNGKFSFPANLALNLEPWRLPTNAIHVPFDSFTAVRGFASWFQSEPWAQAYQMTPAPNQLIVWSLPSMPFQTFAAVPVPSAAGALVQAYERLTPVFSAANAASELALRITPGMTNNEIDFKGLPVAALHLRPLTEPSGQFLYGELFPNTPRSQPLPPELYGRLAAKDLVFYHYEITGERIPQLLQLTQLGLLITRHRQLPAGTAAFKWLENTNLLKTLGPTGTEITQSGPAELMFTRKTPGIFTALELYALANWLEATNFPGCDLKLPHPARPMRPPQQQFQFTPSAPAPSH
jgi:hypothetical protein